MPATVVVVAASPDPPIAPAIPTDAVVIAADGGAEHCRRLGLHVDLLVGDLDSVSDEALAGAGNVERHPVEKDATDLELALEAAARLKPERILVLGGSAGRLDHLLGGLLLIAGDRYASMTVDAQLGEAVVHVIRGRRLLEGRVGELLSLLAVHGPARGISTDGLAYSLRGETLEPGSSRGLSNVFAETRVSIDVESGVLLAMRPTGSAAAGRPDRPPT